MDAFQNIQLSFKCPKALDELTPCQSNWYCDGCRKMVYDFRGMEEAQILQTFEQSGQKLCGIYDAHRIKVLPQQPKWIRASWATVVALGLMILNGCGFGEKKPKVITTSGVLLMPPENYTTGKVKLDTPKHHHQNKKVNVKLPPPVLVGDVRAKETQLKDSTVSTIGFIGAVEINPEFPGGEDAFNKYMADNVKYTGNRQGRAFAQFTVEKNGSLTDIKILRSAGDDIDLQIINALKNCKKWRPGIQNGRPARMQYTVPFNVICKE